ncbi:LysR family transcriptional regulator [Allopusillimonas soli]|uniref:LysR family transcriptional regulator n=1 Tax=Allopusillimonas soli TaxID=659016 RepID=A0A853F666_9BURK|nr:LysR family transcriptional regulator [Allopusillimonas soli]NYT35583.1 LysR family transcriptional regulator [Allopusillimonas soli]TEA75986.1 LysR family transcriptional regulator [Allopusillimonas soli]
MDQYGNLIGIAPGDLQAFVAVAQLASFRGAAATLGISQPALTARVQRLEQTLGQALFSRTTRRVALTRAGERLLGRAERTVNELRAIVQDLRLESELAHGHLAFGVSPTIAASLLPPVLLRFMKAHPSVRITMLDDLAGPLLDKLLVGELDFVLAPCGGITGDFHVQPLFADQMRIIASRSLPIPINKPISFADVSVYPYVSMPRPSAVWRTLSDALRREGKVYAPVFEATSVITLLGLVEAGVGLTAVPSTLLSQRELPKVWSPDVVDVDSTREISLITMKGRSLPPGAARFAGMLKRALRNISV